MLSAVAARRAALASQQAQSPDTSLPVASSSTTPTPPSPAPQSPREKRKPSSQKAAPKTKKARKLKPFEKSNHVRPAAMADEFKEQTEVIEVISESDEDGSDSAMSVLEDAFSGSVPQPSDKAVGKRAWSPSQPLAESSDEEDDDDAEAAVDVASLFPRLPHSLWQSEIDQDEGQILTSFDARPGHNLFDLTDEECRQLGLSSKTTVVALGDDDTLALLGTCTLAVLHGSINMFGMTLLASSKFYPIYAPRSAPLPVLRPAMKASSTLVRGNISDRLQDLLQFRTIIAFQELRTNVEGLGLVCRTFQDTFKPARFEKAGTQELSEDLPGLYMVRQQTKECRAFSLPPTWSTALDSIQPQDDMSSGTYIIKGPKNSGKSSFARSLTNRLLQFYRRVAFLECDVGQSEFTPGGMVSLNIISEPIFGPPFTHPTLPNYAHYIGSNTPRSSPSHYLDAILALIQTYRADVQTPALDDEDDDPRIVDIIPLVVNTMGWSKGLGADLTQKIESMLEATDIFDIQVPTRDEYGFATPARNNAQQNGYAAYHDQSLAGQTLARVHVLEPVASSAILSSYTAADHRTLSILSYFHAQFPADASPKELQQITATSWDVSRPLCAVPPFQVDCSIAFDKVVLTGAGSEDVVEEEIGRVLNGAIVAFVRCEPGTVDVDVDPSKAMGIPYSRHQAPPSPASSQCVGLGLIRGVSPPITVPGKESSSKVTTYLQILTPLPQSVLADARVLVKGELELPVWGMLDFRNFDGKDADMGRIGGVEKDNVPYLQWGKAAEGVLGGDRRRVRRNLMRRGQM